MSWTRSTALGTSYLHLAKIHSCGSKTHFACAEPLWQINWSVWLFLRFVCRTQFHISLMHLCIVLIHFTAENHTILTVWWCRAAANNYFHHSLIVNGFAVFFQCIFQHMKCEKIVKDIHHHFSGAHVECSNCLFCPTDSQKPQDVWHFCLSALAWCNDYWSTAMHKIGIHFNCGKNYRASCWDAIFSFTFCKAEPKQLVN